MILVPLAPSSFLLELRPEHFSQLLLPSLHRSFVPPLKWSSFFIYKIGYFLSRPECKIFLKIFKFFVTPDELPGRKAKESH